MNLARPSSPPWILATIATIVLCLSSGVADGRTVVLPMERPSGPVISSEGTPFEDPELNPQVPESPKVPGRVPGTESAEPGLGSGDVGADGDASRPGWMSRLILWLYRVHH